uniref:ATP synthase F0 subunit 6 n=1 Tax=Lema decempunctata TaxID=1412118 RepID=UPI0022A70582|nr:ATP synthase F0 subunit 6 [Lema decempunctata]UZS91161.1 ATP synthase F0 subunit 6 [Lema decempunctata]
MMMNLFSSFDPSSNMNLSLNWISSMICLICLPMFYWFIPSRLNFTFIFINKILFNELKILILNKHHNTTLLFISLFSLIMFNNFLGLFPYIFTSSSHLTFTLSLALPLWVSFMLLGWIKNTNSMFTHLVPMGTPSILMPFMVCIETISNIIRPITLSVRLSANMIAGHLLMTLMGNTGPYMNSYMLMILISLQILLLTLESAVSIIQAYVFTILSTLYSSESY